MNAGITDNGELLFSGPRVRVLSSVSHAFDFLELEALGGLMRGPEMILVVVLLFYTRNTLI